MVEVISAPQQDLEHSSAGLVAEPVWKLRFRSGAGLSAAQRIEGASVDVLPRIVGVHLQQHAAGADTDPGADLEQPEPDGIHLRLGPLGTLQAQATQSFQ